MLSLNRCLSSRHWLASTWREPWSIEYLIISSSYPHHIIIISSSYHHHIIIISSSNHHHIIIISSSYHHHIIIIISSSYPIIIIVHLIEEPRQHSWCGGHCSASELLDQDFVRIMILIRIWIGIEIKIRIWIWIRICSELYTFITFILKSLANTLGVEAIALQVNR